MTVDQPTLLVIVVGCIVFIAVTVIVAYRIYLGSRVKHDKRKRKH